MGKRLLVNQINQLVYFSVNKGLIALISPNQIPIRFVYFLSSSDFFSAIILKNFCSTFKQFLSSLKIFASLQVKKSFKYIFI